MLGDPPADGWLGREQGEGGGQVEDRRGEERRGEERRGNHDPVGTSVAHCAALPEIRFTMKAIFALSLGDNYYNSSCQLHPVDLSRPKQKNCTMFFKKYRFAETQTWFINIICSTKGQVLSVTYIPSCHIKLNPPPKPEVNLTTVVWFPQYPRHLRFKEYCGQLQLRQQDQPWRDPPLSKECKSKGLSCQIRLPDDLIKGDKYEARIRVQATRHKSTWSDWSPSESWVATVGREKPTVAQPSDQIGSPPGPQGRTHPVFRGAHRAPPGSQHKSQVLRVLQSSRAMLINELYNTNDEETPKLSDAVPAVANIGSSTPPAGRNKLDRNTRPGTLDPNTNGSTHPVFRGAHRAPAGSQYKSQFLHVLQSSRVGWRPRKSRAMLINELYNTNDEETKVSSTMEGVRATLGTVLSLLVFFLIIILIKMDRTTWIYIVKRLRGPPLPHPGKSFLQEVDFKNPKNPPFLPPSESFHLLVKPIEIAQVEVTSSVNAVSPTELEEKVITVIGGQPSTSSSFFNPIYSHLCPPFPPALPLTAGNLETCDADTPYSPSSCNSDKITRQDEDLAILKLLSEGNCKATIVISDYEKVEREETDRIRLQSLDSGMCSTEEVSQESLEADSITKSGDEIEEDENDFQKLFGGEDVLDKGSIQVCSGYEQFQKMPSDTSELLTMDSGFIIGGCGQLANHDDSLTDEEEDQKPAESMLLLDSPHAPVS
ncbi:hypothetical protein D4764_0018270 [Takifugu flavidus]|uniref:Interleukin-2 receptor subunit beta N-terminal domain-containing protein n=1 Tax=Takifugu flavidus TaxID=433684 RepID=A0A5C6MHE2_9TELE|nr:hypothetical protein D4764_0018270 [Takifugu flavidus]